MSQGQRLAQPGCPLCEADGGSVIARTGELRVVQVQEAAFADYPGYLRVIWNSHVAEMSELPDAARVRLLEAVVLVEAALRQTLGPDKVNLASLGNQVPHLHWHVIARFAGDAHFPLPVWAARQRERNDASLEAQRRQLPVLVAQIQRSIGI